AAGDPALEPIEAALAQQPPIRVPSIVLEGAEDGVTPSKPDSDLRHFTALVRREIVSGAGHNLPQETPDAMVQAILELAG
ncbi:MAG: alpha/beta fold hydrolase, partial [Janthinobacterium lividum]